MGSVIAESVASFFKEKAHTDLLCRLVKAGVNTRSRAAARKKGSVLAGKTVVVTGTLVGLSRNEAYAIIKGHGGKASSSVSKMTDFVLAGEKPGSKLTRAKKLGVLVIDLAEFMRIIGRL